MKPATAAHHTHTRAARRAIAGLVLLLALAVWMVTPQPAAAVSTFDAAANGFSVSPLRHDIDISPGTSELTHVTVTNTYDVAMRFTTSVEDFAGSSTDPSATPVLLGRIVESPISGGTWVRPATDSFRLAPGRSADLAVRVTAPKGATGGHYAALIISSQIEQVTPDVRAQSRVAVLYLMNAGGVPPPQLKIVEVVETDDGGTRIVYENGGVTEVTPEPTRNYTDPLRPGGGAVETDTGTCSTALPGGLGECTIPGTGPNGLNEVIDPATGEPVADPDNPNAGMPLSPSVESEVVLDNEGEKFRASAPPKWSGAWSSMLLPLVGLTLFVIYFARIRRRRKDDGEGGDGDPFGLAPA